MTDINRKWRPKGLHVEHYLPGQLGINTHTPRLSWYYTDTPDFSSIVTIEITRKKPNNKPIIEVASAKITDNVLLPWPVEPLIDREQVDIRMRVSGIEQISDWSELLSFDVGILDPFALQGRFIGYPEKTEMTDHRRQPIVRTEFILNDEPVNARLYLTALGEVQGVINGKRVGNDILRPGWTDYENRLECSVYDILPLLKKGKNALGLWLADGWFRGRTGPVGGQVNFYGDKIGVYVQLEVTDINGDHQTIYSNAFDEHWKSTLGPITRSNIYEGEWFDQRLSLNDWDQPNFDDSDWDPVVEVPFDLKKIVFPETAPVLPQERHNPVSIKKYQDKYIIDFGQNCTQRVKLFIHGLSWGDELTLRHVEVLNLDGSPAIRPLRRGVQTDRFISAGKDVEWEAKFTIHGFRYVELTGWSGKLESKDIYSQVYFSDMQPTGCFKSSDQNVNKLHNNTLWSMRSNFVSIPTDCPQRDERLGWTGDIALFAPTANHLYDTSSFLSSWLRDVDYESDKFGTLPVYTPYMPFVGWEIIDAIAIWGDAAVLVPWSIYMNSGDKVLLKSHYSLAKRWVDEVIGYLSEDGIWDRKPAYPEGQLGDWLDPTAPPDEPVKAMTQKELVATAFFINSARLLAQMNRELNLPDEIYYQKIANHSKKGFLQRFFRSDGLMTSDTQCAYALAIALNLLDNDNAKQIIAGNRLATLVQRAENTIATGFAGTPYILPALAQSGHIDVAFDLLQSDKCPSWMYQIKQGATTTWERWDSLLENGEVNPGEMTSFNHYALGSVTDWLYNTVGGISADTPGWKVIKMTPRIGGGITSSKVSHLTPNGVTSLEWEVEEKKVLLDINVPFNVKAFLELSDGTRYWFESGHHEWTCKISDLS